MLESYNILLKGQLDCSMVYYGVHMMAKQLFFHETAVKLSIKNQTF